MEKFIETTKKCFTEVFIELRLLKIAIAILFVANLILTGFVFGLWNNQQDMLKTETMGSEVQKVWELQEIPMEELK